MLIEYNICVPTYLLYAALFAKGLIGKKKGHVYSTRKMCDMKKPNLKQ